MKTLVLTIAFVTWVAAVGVGQEAEVIESPEEVTIESISYWFEAVEFTHSDHVDVAEDCTDCHHDQEPDEISLCSDCHMEEFDPADWESPDLKMAYHQLCVGCHMVEEISTTCIDCHERKALPEGPELGEGEVR
ncbi:MAG: cytochrome c3 family protein [bacterium]|nr:cytochrome c3 family protein [bacterium]